MSRATHAACTVTHCRPGADDRGPTSGSSPRVDRAVLTAHCSVLLSRPEVSNRAEVVEVVNKDSSGDGLVAVVVVSRLGRCGTLF